MKPSPVAASKIRETRKRYKLPSERGSSWSGGRGGAESASTSLPAWGQPCRLLEACQVKPCCSGRSSWPGKGASSSERPEVCFSLLSDNCLSIVTAPQDSGVQAPSASSLEPGNQGVSAGDSWKNQDTRSRKPEYHHTQIKASLWRCWRSRGQQRDCMKTIAFGKKRGEMVPTASAKAEEEEQSTHQPPPQRGSPPLEPVL